MAENEKQVQALLTQDLARNFEQYRRSFSSKGISRTKAANRLIRAGLKDFFLYSSQYQSFFLHEVERHLDDVRKLKTIDTKEFGSLVRQNRLIVRTRVYDDIYSDVTKYIEAYNRFSSTIETRDEAYSSLIRLSIDPDKPWPNG